jgi:hypothetical protein
MPTSKPHRKPGRRRPLPALTDRLRLAGVRVSPICLGIVKDPRVVCDAFDAGINFFFVTADMHWPMYEHTRRGLELLLARRGSVRDDVVVGVVSYVAQPEFSVAPFQEVLDAVDRLERIDVAIMGGVYRHDFTTRVMAYSRHRAPGVLGARATGATFHDREVAPAAIERGLVDIGFIRYNPGHRGAEADVFPLVSGSGSGLLYNFKSTTPFPSPEQYARLALDRDHWRPHITDYYRFALSRPEIDGVLCALHWPAHVTELADALGKGSLLPVEIEHLSALAALGPAAPGAARGQP